MPTAMTPMIVPVDDGFTVRDQTGCAGWGACWGDEYSVGDGDIRSEYWLIEPKERRPAVTERSDSLER